MDDPVIVEFGGTCCRVQKTTYRGSHDTALVLVEADTGFPAITATVRIPGISLSEGEVIIKNYSENEGIVDVLVAAGLIELTDRVVESTHVVMPIVRLLI